MRSPRHVLPFLFLALPLLATACPSSDDDDGGASGTTDADTTSTPTSDGTAVDTGGPSDSGTAGGSASTTNVDDTGASTGDSTGGSSDEESGTTGPVVCGPPVELGVFTPTDGDARGFAVVGDTVFVAVRSGGIEAVDISNPAAPTSLGVLDFGPGELSTTIAVAGEHAYVGLRGSGWKIVDISDPATMLEVASEDTNDAEDVAVVGDTFFVVNGNGIRTYDVSDPTMPSELSATLVLPGASNALVVVGDTAYIAASGGGLVSVDVSDPSSPTELAVFATSANAINLAADGTTVFVAHADGVNILDMTDPAMPVALGLYERDRAYAVAVDSTTLFVLGDDTASTQVPLLAVVDVSDPGTPTELDISLDDFEEPYAVVFDDGRLLFTVEDDDSLHLVDPCPL